MIFVAGLIWDDWNRQHLAKHNLSPEEVETACKNQISSVISYRNRLLVTGKTNDGKVLVIVLSPENVQLKNYGNDIYYVVTAYERKK